MISTRSQSQLWTATPISSLLSVFTYIIYIYIYIYIYTYKYIPQLRKLNRDFTLDNCLFWSVKLTKDVDLDKYKYSGYGIGFGFCLEFSFTDENFEKSIIIFRADMSSYVRIHNKGRDIVIFGVKTNTSIRWYHINNRTKMLH